MKNIVNKLSKACLLLATGTMLFSSCQKDFLDTDPLSFYEPATTFSTESGLKAAMAICDRHMKLYFTADKNEMLPLGTEYMFSEMSVASATDKVLMLSDIANDLTPTSDSGDGAEEHWLNRTNSLWYYWKQTWYGVMYANTIIKYAPQVTGLDESIRDAYLGRAYFHRAYRYMALLMQYGDVPLVTTIIDSPKQDYYSTKRDAILEMLKQDMEWAVEKVPNQSEMSQVGMVNKGACKVLLAKIYLALGEFKAAQNLCDDLINNCGYKLITGDKYGDFCEQGSVGTTWPITRNVIWDMHRSPNKLRKDNTELIMGIPNSGSDKESFVKMLTMRIMYPFFFNSGVQDVDGKQALQNYKRNNSNYDENLDWMRALGRGIATWRLTHYYNHAVWAMVNGKMDEGDMRHSSALGNWINMEDLRVNNRGSKHYGEHLRLFNDEGKLLCSDTIRRWYSMPHYKLWLEDPVNDANVGGSDGNRGATTGGNADWYLYRLAEVYLLRAEAKYYQNPSDATIADDVNIIRKRAGCNELYTAGKVTIGDIMDERARELYFEEWRNCELTRVSLCLARSGKPDEWGNTYDINTFDKQQGTDEKGGSYWYQRCIKYGMYNKGVVKVSAANSQINYQVDKKNIYWPIPESAISSNSKGQLHQNYGYNGYDESVKEWNTWQEAMEAEQGISSAE